MILQDLNMLMEKYSLKINALYQKIILIMIMIMIVIVTVTVQSQTKKKKKKKKNQKKLIKLLPISLWNIKYKVIQNHFPKNLKLIQNLQL